MKIVHIAPRAPYNDYWGYQDNLLPKYHAKMGHDVTLLITNTMHKDGKIVETDCADYILSDNVRVVRLKHKQYPHIVLTNIHSKLPVWDYLLDIKPDFIFYHSLIGTTIFDAIKYKKEINPDCVIVQDNHLDYNIGQQESGIKGCILRMFQRFINRKSSAHVSKIYGVTPWRKLYAEDYYKIPKEKTDVLIMGADDEKIDFRNRDVIRNRVRQEWNISETDFLIITGGKLDNKKNILPLMHACAKEDGIKLLIFGQICDDIKESFNEILRQNSNIIYIGWIDADRVYDYFFAADIVCFPGQHSVLWEQACACKVPCLFKRWEGMEHVNNEGNSEFLDDVIPEDIKQKIEELKFTEKYNDMRKVAMSEKTDIYLYSNIAVKSLECWNER